MKECHEPDLHARQTSGAQSVEARAASASPCSSTLLYLLQVPLKSSRIPSLFTLFMRTICRTFVSHLEGLPQVLLHISDLNLSSLSLQPETTPNTPVPSMDPHVRQNHMLLKCVGIRVFVSVRSCTGKSR